MKLKNWKGLLFIDNCIAHDYDIGLGFINTHFLSLNTTSILQPMIQDVIHNFKMFYLKKIIKQLVENIDNN